MTFTHYIAEFIPPRRSTRRSGVLCRVWGITLGWHYSNNVSHSDDACPWNSGVSVKHGKALVLKCTGEYCWRGITHRWPHKIKRHPQRWTTPGYRLMYAIYCGRKLRKPQWISTYQSLSREDPLMQIWFHMEVPWAYRQSILQCADTSFTHQLQKSCFPFICAWREKVSQTAAIVFRARVRILRGSWADKIFLLRLVAKKQMLYLVCRRQLHHLLVKDDLTVIVMYGTEANLAGYSSPHYHPHLSTLLITWQQPPPSGRASASHNWHDNDASVRFISSLIRYHR